MQILAKLYSNYQRYIILYFSSGLISKYKESTLVGPWETLLSDTLSSTTLLGIVVTAFKL